MGRPEMASMDWQAGRQVSRHAMPDVDKYVTAKQSDRESGRHCVEDSQLVGSPG